MARRFKSITVAKLRELLEGEDDQALVIFAADYGDHCHTEQALPLRGEIDEVAIRESAYSASGYAVLGNDEDDEPEPGTAEEQTYLRIK